MTCLREPLARYRSHLAFEHVSEEDAVAWAEQLQVPRDDPIRRGTAVVDNLYGGRCFTARSSSSRRPPRHYVAAMTRCWLRQLLGRDGVASSRVHPTH